jgi:nitrogen fixation protein NifM
MRKKAMPQVIESGVAYLALKAAQKIYSKATAALQPDEFERIQSIAREQQRMEATVLASPEARDAMVPPSTLEIALQEIRGRYSNEEEFVSDLSRNGLDESSFAIALERELKVEAVLEKVSSKAAKVSEMDVELYYQFHSEKFRRPETRLVRHILITINETIAENTRVEAAKRIAAIAARLTKEPQRFDEQALKHSECPTALDGGKLGDLPRGKLFPELDKALFEMKAGDVSGVLESELGFHILRCDVVTAASILSLDLAKPHIRKLMEKKRKRVCQQAWIKELSVINIKS